MRCAHAPTVVRRYRHGVLLSAETDGTTTFSFYDAFGRVAETSRSIGNSSPLPVQAFDYASCGDLLATHTYTTGTDAITESYAYDTQGNRTATTNALGDVVLRIYDPFGRGVAEDGATYPVRYTYDTDGRRTSLSTTRDGSTWDTTTWAYDPSTGNCMAKTYADGSTVTYTYTPDSLPLRTTYPSGAWKENVYDAKRQVVGVMYSDDETVSFSYDEFGNEIAASNEVSSVVSLRSEQGDCTNETAIVGNESKTTVRAFDEHRRLTEVDGTTYTYNDDGLLASVSNDIAFVEYAYTPDRLDAGYTLTLSNGVVFTRSLVRDDSRRSLVAGISSVANGVGVGSLAYTYDALGRPTSRNADTFGYNERGEVVCSRRDAGNAEENYEYDFIGNLLEASQCASMTNAYVANNLNQYSSIREISAPSAPLREITHDADGNMTQCGDWTYTYDAANRLKTASSNGVLLVTNFYDAKSRRIKKITHGATTTFFYDGWNLIEERVAYTNGTCSTIRCYWGKDLSGTLQGAGGVGGLLHLTVDGAIYIPAYDNNGNITRYFDTDGNTVAQYAYDAFGKIVAQSGSMSDFFRHRFSTKYFDAETGLYYYGYRFYSPTLMRWLNRDPIGEEGGLNLYGFCGNSAVDNTDKKGLMSVWGNNSDVHWPAVDALMQFGDSVMQNLKQPSFWEQFGTAARTLHQEEFFERRYASLLDSAKKYFTKGINLSIRKGKCSSVFVDYSPLTAAYQVGGGNVYYPLMRADGNGVYMSDTPQDWSERWLSLGSFSFCVELPVSVRYEYDGQKKVKKFSWETNLYVSDDLGLTKDDGWLYYATGGFLPGGGLAPSRRITRARWLLKGEGECKCK